MTSHRFKCDTCGRFTRHLHDVPTNPPEGGIDRQECCGCFHPGEDHR